MITATNIHYELGERVQGLSAGGIGAMLLLARQTGLIGDIDHNLHLLKRPSPLSRIRSRPEHRLQHPRRRATCIEHIELRRNDEVFLDALGAERIPDPTTAGDFCRRFTEADVLTLMDAINQARLRVWAQQPADFFNEAILDVDGTLVGTDAECKQGVDIAYDGTWGYHPLIVSLANTGRAALPGQSQRQPPLARAGRRLPRQGDRLVPPGRLPAGSSCGATPTSPRPSISTAGIAPGDIRFLFGIDANPTLKALADALPAAGLQLPGTTAAVSDQDRAPRHDPSGSSRRSSGERGFETIHLLEEMVAEFDYQPGRLPEELSRGRAPQAAGYRQGVGAAARGVSLLLLHHQRPRRRRPTRSCSRPTIAATRRT